ncbi:MAG: hypothetical protein IJY65_01020 [Clostridia bacterium]|nr:hypothetical protein [Clostridia bacterium]
MKLYDEIYFDISIEGQKSEIEKFAEFLTSGALEDYFEVLSDYIVFGDNYSTAAPTEESSAIFTNDDLGVSVDEFDPEDFLDAFARAGRRLDLRGTFYDLNDEEFSFTSPAGDSGYYDSRAAVKFNDELDEEAEREESYDDEL